MFITHDANVYILTNKIYCKFPLSGFVS